MTEERSLDLAQLTLAASRELIGQDFVRHNEDGPDVILRLITAASVRRDPTAEGNSDRPFNLLFRGPKGPQLTQGMHDLDTDGHSMKGIFLVPVGDDADGILYEAIFS